MSIPTHFSKSVIKTGRKTEIDRERRLRLTERQVEKSEIDRKTGSKD